MREVLSYSRRGGRFTPTQQESWDAHHRDWVVPDDAVDDLRFRWPDVFGREAPLIVEIGSWVGEATAALAAARPDHDVVALEVWRPGVAHTLGLLAEAGASNVRLLSVDATWCLEHLFDPGGVAELWTFFPDPWPKQRHHRRRLVAPGFAALAASRLAPGATWRLATDWPAYADQMASVLDAEPLLENAYDGPAPRWPDRPVSYDPAGSRVVTLSVVPTMMGWPEPPSLGVPVPPPAQPARRRAEAPSAPMARPRRPRPLWSSVIVLPLL